MLQFGLFQDDCNISHFVTTRSGGVSKGEYASMNTGAYCGDASDAVTRNREILCHCLSISPDRLFVPYQSHEDKILFVGKSFLSLSTGEQKNEMHAVDAMITDQPSVCIAVTTADCVPVLLYAPDRKVVAAVHAGWRGTVLQIVYKTVQAMIRSFGCDPSCMKAVIGPSICYHHFEVGEEVADSFRNAGIFSSGVIDYPTGNGKPHINLSEANKRQLLQNGLCEANVEQCALCTYESNELLFSARRQGAYSGRMLSGILLNQ